MRRRARARLLKEDVMGAKLLTVFAAGLLVSGCFKEKPKDHGEEAAQQIQQLFDNWGKAFEAKDVDGVMAMYAPGAALTAYDVVPPLQYKGADAYRKDYADLFASFATGPHVSFPGMHIEAGADVAFVYGLERMTGKLTDGTPIDMWLRYTEGLKRIDGQWRVVHEHISVPVDLKTGKAVMDLKP
jgi:ketosteroid isomerase-like protein